MLYRALKDFFGSVCMSEGEVREIDEKAAQRLLEAGFIEAAQKEGGGEDGDDCKAVAADTKGRKKRTAGGLSDG